MNKILYAIVYIPHKIVMEYLSLLGPKYNNDGGSPGCVLFFISIALIVFVLFANAADRYVQQTVQHPYIPAYNIVVDIEYNSGNRYERIFATAIQKGKDRYQITANDGTVVFVPANHSIKISYYTKPNAGGEKQ